MSNRFAVLRGQRAAKAYGFGHVRVLPTSQPESISAELKRVASFDDDRFPRYSVAVWRLKNPQTQEPTYWVGVERYWSAKFEFIDYYFTDDLFYHNNWKNYVAPGCRGK